MGRLHRRLRRLFHRCIFSCYDSSSLQRWLGIDDAKRYFDDDSLESLDADMFLRFAADKSIQMDKSNRAFQLMDEAKKGVVVFEDLQRVCLELGEDMTEDELIEMIEFADSSGDGLINPKRFFRIALKTNL